MHPNLGKVIQLTTANQLKMSLVQGYQLWKCREVELTKQHVASSVFPLLCPGEVQIVGHSDRITTS